MSFYDTPEESGQARHRALHDMTTADLIALGENEDEDPRWSATARDIVAERGDAVATEQHS